MLFGHKQRFAAEIGEVAPTGTGLRRVDLWAAGRWWTCDDNVAYVPQFCASVQDSIDWLRSGRELSQPFPESDPAEAHRRLLAIDDGSRERFWFPRWGPTTDNITAHVFRSKNQLLIPFEFWRPRHWKPEELGHVFVAELPESELIEILELVVTNLRSVSH